MSNLLSTREGWRNITLERGSSLIKGARETACFEVSSPSAAILDFAGAGAWAWELMRPHITNSADHFLKPAPAKPKMAAEQTNWRTLLTSKETVSVRPWPNLFSGQFDKTGTVLAFRYAHSSCARMTRGAKTGCTTSLTSLTSPNSWITYHAC